MKVKCDASECVNYAEGLCTATEIEIVDVNCDTYVVDEDDE